jgi:hypothetical protein
MPKALGLNKKHTGMRSYIATVTIALATCASPSPDRESEATVDFADEGASQPSSTQNRVIGLISLPQVYGDHSCDTYAPVDVVVYAEPDSAYSLGAIHVSQPWTLHKGGGCDGLRVVVQLESADSPEELPTFEYGYETPGAVVLGQQGDWFKIRLAGGEGWIRGFSENRFMAIEELLADNLTYIAEPDGKGMSSAPGSTDRDIGTDLLSIGRSVQVLASRSMNGELWLEVAVHSHSPCESSEEPVTVAEGWLPAHNQGGVPIVWFYSRGC